MVEHQREVEQSVARRAHNPKVEGSNPSLATILYMPALDDGFYVKTCGGVAQLVRASES